MINRIYLHWTAGRYDQLFDDYHICIDGYGIAHYMGDLEEKKAHTWRRNSNAAGIALCCSYQARITPLAPPVGELAADRQLEGVCYGAGIRKSPYTISWGGYPPTKIQAETMAEEVARIAKHYSIPIDAEHVMTHAEVACQDGYGVDDRDPDMRWDLLFLPWEQGASGGDYLRQMARTAYHKILTM